MTWFSIRVANYDSASAVPKTKLSSCESDTLDFDKTDLNLQVLVPISFSLSKNIFYWDKNFVKIKSGSSYYTVLPDLELLNLFLISCPDSTSARELN